MTSCYSIPTLVHTIQDDKIKDEHIVKLRHAGLYTLEKVIEVDVTKLVGILKCDTEFAELVLSKAYSMLPSTWFQTSQELVTAGHKAIKISTGSQFIDNLLRGGVALGEIVELFGESGVGKTQICLTMSIVVQMPENGLEGKSIVIDTRRSLRPERLLEIATTRNMKQPTKALDNVMVIQPKTSHQLLDSLEKVKTHLASDWIPLLIVDSVTGLLRTEFPLNTDLEARQKILGLIMARIRDITDEFQIGVIVTNTSYTSFTFPFTQVPYGGRVMESYTMTRLQLTKSVSDPIRKCKVYQSAHLPPDSCEFVISKSGVS